MAEKNTPNVAHGAKESFQESTKLNISGGWISLALGAVAFIVYLITLAKGPQPGVSSDLAVSALGISPNFSPMHFLWRKIVAAVAGLGGANASAAIHMTSALFGAVAAGLCYSVMVRALSLVIDPLQAAKLPAAQQSLAVNTAKRAVRLGGICASLALAFCIPFWISATACYYHPFYIAWLLLALNLFFAYYQSSDDRILFAWAVVHVAGMTQTSVFIDFFPFLGALVLFKILSGKTTSYLRPILIAAVGGLIGSALLLVSANAFVHSPGCELAWGTSATFARAVKTLAHALWAGTRGNIMRAPWLILVGLSIAPWCAAIVTASRAINGEKSLSFYGLHTIIAVISVLVVLDFRASPWRFLGISNTTIVPYLLTAQTFGYVATYLYLLPGMIFEYGTNERLCARLRAAVAVVFPLIAVVAAVSNGVNETNNRYSGLFSAYADEMLDSMDGRTWLATNGILDNVLRLRAHERGQTFETINLAAPFSPTAIKRIQQKLDNVQLKNSATMGLVTLVQEWITLHPEDVTQSLALSILPDFWGLGKYQTLPNGLVFLGTTDEELKKIDPDATLAKHEAMWKEFSDRFEAVPKSAPFRVRAYIDQIMRTQLSFVGNNLGYLFSTLSRTEGFDAATKKKYADLAYAVYGKIHELDPRNISALLNWSIYVFDRDPSLKEKAIADLDELKKSIDVSISGLPLWSLSRVFGYVENPRAFAELGWAWANTGQPNLAMQAIATAEAAVPEERRSKLKAVSAKLSLLANKPKESERVYYEMLVEDPGDLTALMGLANLNAISGNTAQAREFLNRAKEAGESATPLKLTSALIYYAEGEHVLARAILQEIVDVEPQNTSAWSLLCIVLNEQKDIPGMKEAVRHLETAVGTEHFQTLIARAVLAELGENENGESLDAAERLRAARDIYVRASRQQPANVVLLGQILSLDFRLNDKLHAREDAMKLLRLDLNHSFANYVMGSLSIDSEAFSEAEAYLRRSVEAAPGIANLNDLAYVLYRLGQIEEAGVRVQQAFNLDGADQIYALWDTNGLVLLAQGKVEEAQTAFRHALDLFGEDLRISVHLADAESRLGHKERATELIRTIAKDADSLPRIDRKLFDELHLKVTGTRYNKNNYQ